jgi:glutamate-1-semialdehyde aminotransferase
VVLNSEGVNFDISGISDDVGVPNFPIVTVRFIKNVNKFDRNNSLSHWDAINSDVNFRDKVLKIAMMNQGVFLWQGAGVVTDAHTDEDISYVLRAYERCIKKLSFLLK